MSPLEVGHDDDTDPLPKLRRELVRLRGGRALSDPSSLLRLGPDFWTAVAGGRERPKNQGEIVNTATRLIIQAISRIGNELQRYAKVEFNIDDHISNSDLGERQQVLSSELNYSVKTIRRRGNIALRSIAIELLNTNEPPSPVQTRTPVEKIDSAADGVDSLAIQENPLHRFWGISPKHRVDIVCSELPLSDRPYFADPRDPNYLRYAKFADLDGLVYFRTRMAELFSDAYVRDFSASEYFDSHADHLMVLGGPDWNPKAAEFQEYLPVKLFWNDEEQKTYMEVEGEVLYPKWSSSGSLICEYAMFARFKLRHGLTVNLMSGCLTYGVLGACQCFLHPSVTRSNIEFFESAIGMGTFAVVMKIQDIGGIVQPPDLKTDCIAAFRADEDFSTEFRRVAL